MFLVLDLVFIFGYCFLVKHIHCEFVIGPAYIFSKKENFQFELILCYVEKFFNYVMERVE